MARIATVILLAFAAAGCGDDRPEAKEPAAAPAPLSAADRKLADAQGVCPVSGKELGSMGTPVKIEHEGTVVFFCCGHCREPFEKDPAKYLAKLRK